MCKLGPEVGVFHGVFLWFLVLIQTSTMLLRGILPLGDFVRHFGSLSSKGIRTLVDEGYDLF